MAILVTGGARSGKSAFAERLAATLGDRGLYVATAEMYDEEMRQRVALHQRDRQRGAFPWETREEPLVLAELLGTVSDPTSGSQPPVVLVDCLTLWLSNQLLLHGGESGEAGEAAAVMRLIAELTDAVKAYPYPLVLVTNEVGDGIVPATPLGRQYRDLSGRMNQQLAAICSQVFLVTAGIPIELKSIAYRL